MYQLIWAHKSLKNLNSLTRLTSVWCGQFMGENLPADDPACIYLKSQISLNASNRIYFEQTDRILTCFFIIMRVPHWEIKVFSHIARDIKKSLLPSNGQKSVILIFSFIKYISCHLWPSKNLSFAQASKWRPFVARNFFFLLWKSQLQFFARF